MRLHHHLSVVDTCQHLLTCHSYDSVMDKSEAMQHEACIPNSWWEFTITHAIHVYNCTPLQHHNWHTPYEMLHKQQPDIAHLRVFGCAAYVHIPENIRTNKMAPKSELIVYLGVAPGNTSNFLFMWSPNKILFISAHALFDESCYPHYAFSHMCPIAQPVPSNAGEHVPIRPLPPASDDHLPNQATAQAPFPPPIPPPRMPSPCPSIPPSLIHAN